MKELLKQKLIPGRKTVKRWRNLLIVLVVIVAAYYIHGFYINSFQIYDFSHLTPVVNMGQMSEFVPLAGESVPGMVRAAQNEYIALYVYPQHTTIAVYDMRNGHIWYSSPPGRLQDSRANPQERNIMHSIAGIRFYDARRNNFRWTYNDSVAHEQADIFSIPNGITIRYLIGNTDLGIHALPRYIEIEQFQTRVLDEIEDDADRGWLSRNFTNTPAMPDFMRMGSGIMSGVNAQRTLRIFEEIGWTEEETEFANAISGHVPEITRDLVVIYIEFAIDGDSLIVNVPLDRIEMSNEVNRVSDIELMRFFGAGSEEDEGFLLIPSGSGALIEFNNNRFNEERFIAPMYGFDFLTNPRRPQVLQSVRLPVFGINHGNAAMIAHVENGAALASMTADVAGRGNSFNYAWFSFSIRQSQRVEIGLPGNHRVNSMNIIQQYAYYGDITIRYHFIAGDGNIATLGDMAAAYRQFLVKNGDLTPITENNDRTFYLDIIGTVDVVNHFLGVPYMTEQVMTSFADANHILDNLNAGGIYNVQMQLHGWFNGGINHYVARNVNQSRRLGSQSEMQALNARLQADGGALNPAVNFMLTNFHSRRFNSTFEAARDIPGMRGVMSRVARDMLSTRFSYHSNDWFYIVHPGVIPFHVESFMPAYRRSTGLDSLALLDMGDFLTESMYRQGSVDREHSRLISREQLGLLNQEFPHLVVFGGNDYAIRYASHLVDVPTRADWFYIIDHEVPFYQMVMHGYIEFAGSPVNLQSSPDVRGALLNSMATGASPRFTMTAEPTRIFQFSPHERMYSTQYVNWIRAAVDHYQEFNDVYRYLLTERIIDFIPLYGSVGSSVSVTVFSNGTRIYVNNTNEEFVGHGVIIPPMDFVVK